LVKATKAVILDLDAPHQKYTYKLGERIIELPSVTQILGKHISKPNLVPWAHGLGKDGKCLEQHGGRGRRVGSITHFLIDCHLSGQEADLSKCDKDEVKDARNIFETWHEWWEKGGFKLVYSELQLSSENLGYGGTVDLIAKDRNGRVFICDYKTGSRLHTEYSIQIAAYKLLYEDMLPFDEGIQDAVLLRIGKDGDLEERKFEDLTSQLKVWNAILHLHAEYKKIEDRTKGQTWPQRKPRKRSS